MSKKTALLLIALVAVSALLVGREIESRLASPSGNITVAVGRPLAQPVTMEVSSRQKIIAVAHTAEVPAPESKNDAIRFPADVWISTNKQDRMPVIAAPVLAQAPPPPISPITTAPAPQDAFSPIPPPPSTVKTETKSLPSLWSLQMEQRDNRNVIRATIGKKNDIAIESDSVAYQTPHGTFKAVGNVELTSANIHCQCESLTIVLTEDRLILEGKAKITVMRNGIRYHSKAVDANEVFMDLEGERISLRLFDLQVKLEPKEPAPPRY